MKRKLISFLIFLTAAFIYMMPLCLAAEDTSGVLKLRSRQESALSHKKSEGKNVLSKFLVSMLWVAGSCAAIFLILLAYKRIKGTSFGQTRQIEVSKNLNSPETVDDAVKLFIEKF